MKIFQCSHCAHPVFFENISCENCGHVLGYLNHEFEMYALYSHPAGWSLTPNGSEFYRYCDNHAHGVCNWLVPADSHSHFCEACSFNRTIPYLGVKENWEKWQKLELAKHRLIYSLKKMTLPLESKLAFSETGLCFDFLADELNADSVKTGHANGVITILLSEADPVLREQTRRNLKEPYRTLIGHFRHEIGHYYWDRLIRPNVGKLNEFRMLFGNETQDYNEALSKYYNQGSYPNWQQSFISEYASSHPWEDWAETWAHYLHLIDTMETAYYFGLDVNPGFAQAEYMKAKATFDPYERVSFDKILDYSIPLFFAVNSLNRSMGISDIYPFVISEPVVRKLKFIHDLVQPASGDDRTMFQSQSAPMSFG